MIFQHKNHKKHIVIHNLQMQFRLIVALVLKDILKIIYDP